MKTAYPFGYAVFFSYIYKVNKNKGYMSKSEKIQFAIIGLIAAYFIIRTIQTI